MGVHDRQQYGSSVATTGAVHSDIERYIELVCMDHITFRRGIFQPWAARRGKDGA
jgi:hypothetical protein